MASNQTDTYIETLMKEFPKKIDWNAISKNKDVSVNFIEKYFDKLQKFDILQNNNVFPEHIEKWFAKQDIINNGSSIVQNPNLTDEFVRNYYPNSISNDGYYQFVNFSLSEFSNYYNQLCKDYKFIKHNKYICHFMQQPDPPGNHYISNGWTSVVHNPNIIPSFIEKYADKIGNNYFAYIKWNPNLTKAFIDKYADILKWDYFVEDTGIPFEYYKQYLDKISYLVYQKLKTLPLKLVNSTFYNCWANVNIDSKFIEKNKEIVNWNLLSQNTSLTIDMTKKYHKELNWNYIWQNSFKTASGIKSNKTEDESDEDIKSDEEISNNEPDEDIELDTTDEDTKPIKKVVNITAYFVPFKRFNMIEIVEDDTKQELCRELYKTDISEETWEFLTKNKSYNIIKTKKGIKIKIGDITIHGYKIAYKH